MAAAATEAYNKPAFGTRPLLSCSYNKSSSSTGVVFSLLKNRQGFESYPINAVMILKDETYSFPYPYTLKYAGAISITTALYECMHTAQYTPEYCQAFAYVKQYQMHHF